MIFYDVLLRDYRYEVDNTIESVLFVGYYNIASHTTCMLCISREIVNHEGLTIVSHEGLTLNATKGIPG